MSLQDQESDSDDLFTMSTSKFWLNLILFACISSIVILIVSYLVSLFIALIFGWNIVLSFILLFEAGLVFFFGGVYGTTRTSISISKFKEKIFKEPPISISAIRTASQSVLTYTLLGFILFIFGLIIGFLGS